MDVDLSSAFFYATPAANAGREEVGDKNEKAGNDGAVGLVQCGPVKLAEMVDLARRGALKLETLIWTPGMPEWKAVRDIPRLQAILFDKTDRAPVTMAGTEAGRVEDSSSKGSIGAKQGHKRPLQPTREVDSSNPETTAQLESSAAAKRQKYLDDRVTAVYVSNLPLDATEEEVAALFGKYGILQSDPLSGAPSVRLYKNKETGNLKGDGVVVYVDRAAMENAKILIDGAPLRANDVADPLKALRVERAKWQPNFAFGGKMKAKDLAQRTETFKRALKVRNLQHEQALSWNEEGLGVDVGLKIVVLRNLFDPDEKDIVANPVAFQQELQQDLKEECELRCGAVKKVSVFPTHPEGVATIKFRATRSAEKCVELMNGRTFDGRKVAAEYWDGNTDFRPQESFSLEALEQEEQEHQRRLDKFAADLE